MKKKIALIISLLLITGCSANYEINIKNNKITEKVTLIEKDSSLFDKKMESGSTLREAFDDIVNYEDPFGVPTYEAKSINTNNTLGIEYKVLQNKELSGLSGLNKCYKNPKVEVVNGIVKLETGDNFECYDYYELLDSVKVVINTNHKVIESNADEKKGNSYIWNITKDGNKNIKFSYKEKIDSSNKIIVVIVVLLFFIIISALLFLKKSKKNNEI